ncbi:MAG: zinc ribbon domain-containing protein [Peptococcia bacterium]|jgi:predicted  nucleic acid-binding Zn-ribbon protein
MKGEIFLSQEKVMSQEELVWKLQELKRKEAEIKNGEELKPWVGKLKALQAKVQGGEQESEDLTREISAGEKNARRLEQEINELSAQTSEKKEKLYASKGGPLKEILSMQQAILKQEEQTKEAEKTYWEMNRQIEEWKKKIVELTAEIKSWKREYNEGVREYKKIKEQYDLKLAALQSQLEEVAEQLQPQTLKLVKSAEKRYPLSFVAMLKNGTCTGCRIGVSATSIREVKAGKGFYHCDNCGRLLINPF